MLRVLEHRNLLFNTSFDRIIYFLPHANLSAHDDFIKKLQLVCPKLEIKFDLPLPGDIKADLLPKLFLIDDLMQPILISPYMEQFFAHDSHHYNCSVFFTLQNYYGSSKSKTVIRQTTYKILFNDSSDHTLMRNISCQIAPTSPQFLTKCFHTLESKFENYQHYLVIDSHPKSDMKQLFVRTKIFPDKNNEIKPLCFFPS